METFRDIKKTDYNKNYLNLLKQLSVINPELITHNDFNNFVNNLTNYHRIIIVEDVISSNIIATGTLLIEQKLIHNFGLVAHIEDVIVDSNYRSNGIGKRLINYLVDLATKIGCYKVILNCNENNTGFYEKCGFIKKEIEMAKYL